jgi:transposase
VIWDWEARGLPPIRPPKLDVEQAHRMVWLYQQGEPVSELAGMFAVSRRTAFRVIRRGRDTAA